jgi:tetratricopeptide (TPR) repeat protein
MTIRRALLIIGILVLIAIASSMGVWYWVKPEIQFFIFWIALIIVAVFAVVNHFFGILRGLRELIGNRPDVARAPTPDVSSALADSRAPDAPRTTIHGRVISEPARAVLSFVQEAAGQFPLLPLGLPANAVIAKIELLNHDNSAGLSELEAFVLITANCLPSLLQQYQGHSGGGITREKLARLIQDLSAIPSSPPELRATLMDVSTELIAVANSLYNLDLAASQYIDTQLRGERIRVSLLASLTRLAGAICLDHFVEPDLPERLANTPWLARGQWWRQAFVRSVHIERGIIQFFLMVPKGWRAEYGSILAEPLDEHVKSIIQLVNPVLTIANLDVELRPAQVDEGDVIAIPDEDWRILKRDVEQEQAYRSRDRLEQDAFRLQRLRTTLVGAEVNVADQMLAEGRPTEAAAVYSRVAELLFKANEIYQARHYAFRAGETYATAGEQELAARHYLRAAQIWLAGGLTPQLAQEGLERAHRIADELNEVSAQVAVLETLAHYSFVLLNDDGAARAIDDAYRLIPAIGDGERRLQLSREVIIQHGVIELTRGNWEVAIQTFARGLEELRGLGAADRVELLGLLFQGYSETGQWNLVDRGIQDNAALIEGAPALPRGKLLIQYAVTLARQARFEEALNQFGRAIDAMQAEAGPYEIGLAYQTKQHVLLRSGIFNYPDMAGDEARRIDLFNQTRGENVGYLHEEHATASMLKGDLPETLQHLRIALWHFRRHGAWAGINHIFGLLAKLHASPQVGETIVALGHAIRAGNPELAEELSRTIAQRSGLGQINGVISSLIADKPSVSERLAAIRALAMVVDLVPPDFVEDVLHFLLGLMAQVDRVDQDTQVRRYAVQALKNLTPQFTTGQVAILLEATTQALSEQQPWLIREELLKLVNDVFLLPGVNVSLELRGQMIDIALAVPAGSHLRPLAERVAIHAARTAPEPLRQRVVDFVQLHVREYDRPAYLAVLIEPVPEAELEETITRILRAANTRPLTVGNTTQISIPAIWPTSLRPLIDIVPADWWDRIVSGLLEAIINEHGSMGIRSDAIWMLSELPDSWLSERAHEVIDYLLWGAAGTLPRSPMVNMDLDSQTNPFARFRINFGNVEQVRQSSLNALGRIYRHLDTNARVRVTAQLVASGRDSSSIVRQGVALGLGAIESDEPLDTRLLLSLFVLLHDADSRPCSWACVAAGNLIQRNLTAAVTQDTIERLLELSASQDSIETRVGAALGLRAAIQNGNLPDGLRPRMTQALESLTQDVSHRVRFNARGD